MIDYDIWKNTGTIVKEIELHENYEIFIHETVKYFRDFNWIIKLLNETDSDTIRSIGYFEEISNLNEGIEDNIIDLLRCADRAVRQYCVPINKFLDDVERILLNDDISIDMVIFTSFKNLVVKDGNKSMYRLK